MVEVLIGVLVIVVSIGGLWFSLPVGGQMRSFAQNGRDTYIAIAVTVGIGLGFAVLIAGIALLVDWATRPRPASN
jgi:hypothetical protein